MATNNKLLNCPPLRFPEFFDEWKQTTLGEVCQIIGGGTPSTEIDKYWGGNIPWFTPSEIRKKHIGHSERTITEEGLNNSGARLLPKGTILLTTRATIGECSISTIPCCTNQGFQSLVVNLNKSTTEFIYQKVHTLRNELLIRANGSTFKEITAQEIRGIHIFIPTLMEQQKIASFLSLLDERIEAQRQIIKERKKQKKALLHQLFSQSLRFPNFEDEWQQTTLGRIAEIMKGSGISKDQLSPQGHPCILYGELYTKYLSEVIREIKSHTEIDPSSLILSQAGDVIIPSSGETAIDIAVARCVPVDNVALGSDLNIIRSSTTDGRFLAYQLNGAKKKEIAEFAQGVAVIHLYGRDLSKLRISLPILAEQQKIAEFLSLIDERIEVEEILLQKYEEQKRYLLRKMFV